MKSLVSAPCSVVLKTAAASLLMVGIAQAQNPNQAKDQQVLYQILEAQQARIEALETLEARWR